MDEKKKEKLYEVTKHLFLKEEHPDKKEIPEEPPERFIDVPDFER